MSVAARVKLSRTTSYAALRLGSKVETWAGGLVHQLQQRDQDLAISVKDIREHGQAQLALRDGEAVLSPFGGNRLLVDNRTYILPADGIACRPPATANTTYYLYAYPQTRDTLALEARTEGPTTLSLGFQVMTGDSSRMLVGMGRTGAAGVWAQVSNWFRPTLVGGRSQQTAARSTASAPWVEIHSELRVGFLVWAGAAVGYALSGRAQNDTAGSGVWSAVGFDGLTPEVGAAPITSAAAGQPDSVGVVGTRVGLSEGYHEAYALGGRRTSGTASWGFGEVAGDNLALSIWTLG